MAFLQVLLDQENYIEAALLCWGRDLFNPEPKSVQKVWTNQMRHNKNIYLGASALGKSYNLVAWNLLDWVRDPAYTNTKFLSTTAGHAKANTWSTLTTFHKSSKIPLPGIIQSSFIGIEPENRQAAIGLVAIPQGEDGKGRLQGFHPLPRPKPHPSFGKLTRVRLFMDEAETVPGGVWPGVDNMLANEDEAGSVKISAATNPARSDSMLAAKAEGPERSWLFDPEAPEEWDSEEGWHVTVLDAAKTENVMQKKKVFPGLQTYEGYMNLVRRGQDSEALATFGRGRYPATTVRYNVVPQHFLDKARGTYIWMPGFTPTPIGSFDGAFEEGGDSPEFTSGLYGYAESFVPLNSPEIKFTKPKWVIQAEQQFPIEKAGTPAMADNLIELCRDLHIRPEWFIMDRTGNATGLHDLLLVKFGGCLGVRWGENSTDRKILEEAQETADLLFPDIVSEMWFSYSMWLEYGYIRHAPLLPTQQLYGELTGRSFHRVGKIQRRVETKESYKRKSGGKSPDHADSLIMLVHLIRMRAMTNAAMLQAPVPPVRRDALGNILTMKGTSTESIVDRMDFVNAE